jgi:hypothetical protein
MRWGILMLVVVAAALSGCGGAGGTGLTSTQATRTIASHPRQVSHAPKPPKRIWKPACESSAVITYGGCGMVEIVPIPSGRQRGGGGGTR